MILWRVLSARARTLSGKTTGPANAGIALRPMSMSFQTLLFDYASMMVYTGTTVRELSWRVLNEEWRDVE